MVSTRSESPSPSRILRPVIDLLFPPRCLLCTRDLPSEDGPAIAMVCDECRAEAATDSDRCSVCGECVVGGTAHRCRGVPWRRIAILGGYDGLVREAVLRGKRPGGEHACRALGMLWVERHGASAAGWGCDLVVPVPMHWTRRLARGASSAERIAAAIAEGMRCRMEWAVVRVRRTRMQNELPREERPANVDNAFRSSRSVAGRRVWLVDDVVTTGSTVRACCDAIMKAGATGVCVAAIAKADGQPHTHR